MWRDYFNSDHLHYVGKIATLSGASILGIEAVHLTSINEFLKLIAQVIILIVAIKGLKKEQKNKPQKK